MRQTLDSQVASGGTALGCIDFTRGGGGGGGRPGSQAGERQRYLEALARHCQVGEGWAVLLDLHSSGLPVAVCALGCVH